MRWLDQQQPFSIRQSRAQIRAVLELLGPTPRKVLDLGCGAGRVLVPLARAGHQVVGIDADLKALTQCRSALRTARATAELIHGDFRRLQQSLRGFDAVLCLGNTFMSVADADVAVRMLSSIRDRLARRGVFILDDLPRSFVPELSSGRWQNGLSPDGQMQMIWHPTDAVFTVRTGRRINLRQWSLKDTDVRFRLWCDGSLWIALQQAGLSAPARRISANLLVMTCAAGANGFTGTAPRRRRSGR